MPWKCFWLEPIWTCERYLRRYSHAEPKCKNSYHNAMQPIPEGKLIRNSNGTVASDPMTWDKCDPKWPEKCEHCDYKFTKEDDWQLFFHPQYKTIDGTIYTLENAPIGAMWNAEWLCPHWAGPDGLCLCVKLPPGKSYDYWTIDGPSSQNRKAGAWKRTGIPPLITVTPSIKSDKYHGWLRSGELTDDCEGKKF